MTKTSKMLDEVEKILTENNYKFKRDYVFVDVTEEGKIVERIFTYAIVDKYNEPLAFIDYTTTDVLKWANDDLLSAKYVYFFKMKKIEARIKRKIILISEDMNISLVTDMIKKKLDTVCQIKTS